MDVSRGGNAIRAQPDRKNDGGFFTTHDRIATGHLPATGEVDAEEDYCAAEDLVRREARPEKQDARRHANERDQVLVDEYSVGPDLRDASLPGPEPESRHQERRVGQGLPGSSTSLGPPGLQKAGQREWQAPRPPNKIVCEATTSGEYLRKSGKAAPRRAPRA